MRVEKHTHSLDELETDLLVSTLFEDERPPRGVSGLVDWRLNGFLSRAILQGIVRGTEGEVVLLPLHRRLPARRFLIFGLGRRMNYHLPQARFSAYRLGKLIAGLRTLDVGLAFPPAVDEKLTGETEQAVTDSLRQASLPRDLLLRWLDPRIPSFYQATLPSSTVLAV